MESTASLLIALGGFCKAMVDLGCFPGDLVYRWAESCFFVFQLPIFYFGYGYLFQKQWRVRNLADWQLQHEISDCLHACSACFLSRFSRFW